jgi:glucoselysine-6-phosphate deglycase
MQIGNYIRRQASTVAGLPLLLERDLDALPSLKQKPERIVLVGTGSSMNALLAGADALERSCDCRHVRTASRRWCWPHRNPE